MEDEVLLVEYHGGGLGWRGWGREAPSVWSGAWGLRRRSPAVYFEKTEILVPIAALNHRGRRCELVPSFIFFF
jgi:hypothetical protein